MRQIQLKDLGMTRRGREGAKRERKVKDNQDNDTFGKSRKDEAVTASVEESEMNKNERVIPICMIRRLGVTSWSSGHQGDCNGKGGVWGESGSSRYRLGFQDAWSR